MKKKTIQARQHLSELFKIINVYINKAMSSDRKIAKLRQTVFNPHTWDSDTPIGNYNISSAIERKELQLTFENQLFEYIHYYIY